MTKLSIIVPVYNVEEYIHACIDSIFRQGLDDEIFEVIIVNDGTQDRSMEIIDDIISQHDNITIINQNNQGLSVSRNNGISAAKGEYLLMIDSDDLLIDNSLPKLLSVINETEADMIVADFIKRNSNEIKNKYYPQPEFKIKEMSGNELFLDYFNPHESYVWHILYRRLFLTENNISFVPGIFYQDVPFNHECYLKAKKCIKVSLNLNIYRTGRLGAATYSFDKKKAFDYCTVIEKTWGLRPYAHHNVLRKLEDDIFASFTSLVYFTSHEIKTSLERKQIIDYLRKLVPDLAFHNGIRQKVNSIAFNLAPHTFIRLRMIYGRVFEDAIIPFFRKYLLFAFINDKNNE